MSNLLATSCLNEPGAALRESDVVEVPLLLPTWQITALETAAHARGLTAASMVRHLLNDFITGLRPNGSARDARRRGD
jgi:hypothetical protein